MVFHAKDKEESKEKNEIEQGER